MEQVFGYLSSFLRGWLGYFGLADMREFITKLNAHIRRVARTKMLKQWKRTYRRGINLQTSIVTRWRMVRGFAGSRCGAPSSMMGSGVCPTTGQSQTPYTTNISSPSDAPTCWPCMRGTHSKLLNRRDTRVRPVVWEDSRGPEAKSSTPTSYSIHQFTVCCLCIFIVMFSIGIYLINFFSVEENCLLIDPFLISSDSCFFSNNVMGQANPLRFPIF